VRGQNLAVLTCHVGREWADCDHTRLRAVWCDVVSTLCCVGLMCCRSRDRALTAEEVDHQGARRCAAVPALGHFVMVSSMLVTPANRWHPVRLLLNNLVKYGARIRRRVTVRGVESV
jgi:hypothetical protein